MSINIQKGLFRIYKVVSIIILILAFPVLSDEWNLYWELSDIQERGLEYFAVIAISLLLSAAPWGMHYFIKWIIRGFSSQEKHNTKGTDIHCDNRPKDSKKKPTRHGEISWKYTKGAMVAYACSILLRHSGSPGGIELGYVISGIPQWIVIGAMFTAIVALVKRLDRDDIQKAIKTLLLGVVFLVVVATYRYAIRYNADLVGSRYLNSTSTQAMLSEASIELNNDLPKMLANGSRFDSTTPLSDKAQSTRLLSNVGSRK